MWPCGQRAGLATGTPLTPVVNGTMVTTRVSLAPGDGGRICVMSGASTTLSVAVNSVA